MLDTLLLRIAGTFGCLGFLYLAAAVASTAFGCDPPIQPFVGLMIGMVAAASLWGLELFWITFRDD